MYPKFLPGPDRQPADSQTVKGVEWPGVTKCDRSKEGSATQEAVLSVHLQGLPPPPMEVVLSVPGKTNLDTLT